MTEDYIFSSKEELLGQAEKDGACLEGLVWAKEQKDLESILKDIPKSYRLWCLENGYIQFAEHCPWEQLKYSEWFYILAKQPQFENFLQDWNKFPGSHLSVLLSRQPQFIDKCPLEKLDGYDWSFLLSKQPQFAERCNWSLLDRFNLTYLLLEQPQLSSFCN